MNKRFIFTIATIVVIALIAGVAIFLAKGYTFSPTQKRIVGTGIITISSEPDAASVYIDNHLTTATNATVSSLPPKQYTVKVVKEGFIPWEKQVMVKEGLVTELKLTLFPAIPTIYPLTFNGVANPILSPDGDKLAFVVPSGKKAGVWVWTMAQNQPIAFARGAEPHQIVQSLNGLDFSKASLKWSPDSKQVLASSGANYYLLNSDNLNTDPRDIAPVLESTLKSWDDDNKAKDQARTLTIKDINIRQIASASAIIKWSPDETKFMVRKDPLSQADIDKGVTFNDFKVYDLSDEIGTTKTQARGNSTNRLISDKKEYSLPAAKAYYWLPDSRHIILVEDNQISIVDSDGTNKAIIYAGSFQDSFVFAWPDSSRLVMISSFPTPTASEPNLYGINLK